MRQVRFSQDYASTFEAESLIGRYRYHQPRESTPPLQSKVPSASSTATDDVPTSGITDDRDLPFTYEPLNLDRRSIRLVEVQALKWHGLPECTIRNATLIPANSNSSSLAGMRTAPDHNSISYDYTCVSYIWGPPGGGGSIIMNGRFFEVRKNLWDFLYAVAKRCNLASQTSHYLKSHRQFAIESFKCLWIDALCIDQTSVPERNHQVQQMGQIYYGANHVIAWLGDHKGLCRLLTLCWTGTLRHYLQSKHKDTLKSVQAMCDHEYWRRAWITQEVILARNLCFFAGRTVVKLEDLLDDGTYQRSSPLQRVLDENSRGSRSHSLLVNFERFRHKKCSEPRDLAYSLIAISRDGQKLNVDYESSLAELTRNILSASEDETCFHRAAMLMNALGVAAEDCLLLETPQETTLRHVSPCALCGEDARRDSLTPSTPSPARMRCFCLQCSHPMRSEFKNIHSHGHSGHLMLIWASAANTGAFDWHLFWTAMGGGPWRKLNQRFCVATNDKGRYKSLALSMNVIKEISELAAQEQARRDSVFHRAVLETYESTLNTTWKVAA